MAILITFALQTGPQSLDPTLGGLLGLMWFAGSHGLGGPDGLWLPLPDLSKLLPPWKLTPSKGARGLHFDFGAGPLGTNPPKGGLQQD